MTPEQINERFELFERRINEQEAVMANLLMGYMEMWAAVEMVFSVTMNSRSAEEQAAFMEQLNELRQNTFAQLKEVSRSGLEGLSPDVADFLGNMAKGN